MKVITNEKNPGCLEYLLEFLAAWDKRPTDLTQMAYQWCSAMSKAAGRLEPRERPQQRLHGLFERYKRHYKQYIRRLYRQELSDPHPFEGGFSEVGPKCDQIHRDGVFHSIQWGSLEEDETIYLTLEIAFRLAVPDHDQPDLSLSHTAECDKVLETAFSSGNDDIIADAVCAWVVDDHNRPTQSFVHYLAKRVANDSPFSPRLRQLSMHVIKNIWHGEFAKSKLETVHLLNCLKVDVDDMVKKDDMTKTDDVMGVGGMSDEWVKLLLHVIYSEAGQENLSSHYWHLLDKLQFGSSMVQSQNQKNPSLQHDVTTSLEKTGEWEKLEAWMVVSWKLLQSNDDSLKGEIEQATLRLLSHQPSALPRFEDLCESVTMQPEEREALQQVCEQVRADQLSGSHAG